MEIVSVVASSVAAVAALYALLRSFRTDRGVDAVQAIKASEDFSKWLDTHIENAQIRMLLELIEKRTFVETAVYEHLVSRIDDLSHSITSLAQLGPAIERLQVAIEENRL
jgi:hypothetical protein